LVAQTHRLRKKLQKSTTKGARSQHDCRSGAIWYCLQAAFFSSHSTNIILSRRVLLDVRKSRSCLQTGSSRQLKCPSYPTGFEAFTNTIAILTRASG
jgi:hypothetical protein